MPIIASFDQWKAKKVVSIKRLGAKEIPCPDCNGSGEIDGDIEDDDFYDCGLDFCDRCDGTGNAPASGVTAKDFSCDEYFDEVVTDIKAYCLWTKRDFLAEVGPFVGQFRKAQ